MHILPKMKILLMVMAFFVGCYAIEFKYPDKDPCIIVIMNANLSLTMTNTASNATMKVDGVLDGIKSGTGACGDTPNMDVTLNPTSNLSGTLSFSFSKSSDSKVSMVITYSFVPDGIFKNSDGTPQTLTSASVPLSSDNTSYTCTAAKEIMFNTGTSKGFKYEFKMHISQVQIQAFNIKEGKFSPADDCTAADMTSEAPALTTQQVTTQPPAPTTEPPAPTTQPQPKNETTTEAPVTTKNATSEAPTTSVVPTTVTTTEQPTTIVTTVVPTTTTPGPTNKPGSPDTNTYTADTVNTTCLLLKAGIEFTVQYVATGGASKTVVVGIPKGFTVKGNCNGTNTTQSLSVSFYNNLWILTMIFAESSDQFYMSGVDLNAVLDSSVIKDINNTVPVKINKMFGSDQFSAAKDGSYKCSADTTLTLNEKVSMNTYNLQYAAFQTFPKNTTDFTGNNISECSGDTTTNSVVPIAVGAALAGLVVIVLIAYLIGRRRSRAAGYEQV